MSRGDLSRPESKLFLSHIGEEQELARIIEDRIQTDFVGMIPVFRSTNPHTLVAGERWLDRIDEALDSSVIMIALCSPQSVKSNWINFECGAAWSKDKRTIPLCHSGMTPTNLPQPLQSLQAVRADQVDGWQRLYISLSEAVGSSVPSPDWDSFLHEVGCLEREYSHYRDVRGVISELITKWEDAREIFSPSSSKRVFQGFVWQVKLEHFINLIRYLEQEGYIGFSSDLYSIEFTGPGSHGQRLSYRLELKEKYFQSSDEILRDVV